MNYFIKGEAATGAQVDAVMRTFDLKGAAAITTTARSPAKTEIVSVYRAALKKAVAPKEHRAPRTTGCDDPSASPGLRTSRAKT